MSLVAAYSDSDSDDDEESEVTSTQKQGAIHSNITDNQSTEIVDEKSVEAIFDEDLWESNVKFHSSNCSSENKDSALFSHLPQPKEVLSNKFIDEEEDLNDEFLAKKPSVPAASSDEHRPFTSISTEDNNEIQAEIEAKEAEKKADKASRGFLNLPKPSKSKGTVKISLPSLQPTGDESDDSDDDGGDKSQVKTHIKQSGKRSCLFSRLPKPKHSVAVGFNKNRVFEKQENRSLVPHTLTKTNQKTIVKSNDTQGKTKSKVTKLSKDSDSEDETEVISGNFFSIDANPSTSSTTESTAILSTTDPTEVENTKENTKYENSSTINQSNVVVPKSIVNISPATEVKETASESSKAKETSSKSNKAKESSSESSKAKNNSYFASLMSGKKNIQKNNEHKKDALIHNPTSYSIEQKSSNTVSLNQSQIAVTGIRGMSSKTSSHVSKTSITAPYVTTNQPYFSVTAPYGASTKTNDSVTAPYGASNKTNNSVTAPYGEPKGQYSSVTAPYGASHRSDSSVTAPYGEQISSNSSVTAPYGELSATNSSIIAPYGEANIANSSITAPYGRIPNLGTTQTVSYGYPSGSQSSQSGFEPHSQQESEVANTDDTNRFFQYSYEQSSVEGDIDYYNQPNQDLPLDKDAIVALQGKGKKRHHEEINIIDVDAANLQMSKEEYLKNLSTQSTYRSKKGKGGQPSSKQKRKHQITYLAYQARERELELKEAWAANRYTRQQTQSKYGF